ncbi:MAG: methionine--tRNA ligase, partial [Parcubacteria group bacterium]|nr:methionine--tRNA ligase [Parcubacteria group bacterium]
MITIEDFKKLDIRIGKIISAEKVSDSLKLIKLVFDTGDKQK